MNENFNENNSSQLEINENENPQEKPISVYVKVNEQGFVTDVSSEIFINNFDGWVKIDEGFGDKYAHAQSHYFDSPLVNENGEYTKKLKKDA